MGFFGDGSLKTPSPAPLSSSDLSSLSFKTLLSFFKLLILALISHLSPWCFNFPFFCQFFPPAYSSFSALLSLLFLPPSLLPDSFWCFLCSCWISQVGSPSAMMLTVPLRIQVPGNDVIPSPFILLQPAAGTSYCCHGLCAGQRVPQRQCMRGSLTQ